MINNPERLNDFIKRLKSFLQERANIDFSPLALNFVNNQIKDRFYSNVPSLSYIQSDNMRFEKLYRHLYANEDSDLIDIGLDEIATIFLIGAEAIYSGPVTVTVVNMNDCQVVRMKNIYPYDLPARKDHSLTSLLDSLECIRDRPETHQDFLDVWKEAFNEFLIENTQKVIEIGGEDMLQVGRN